MQTKAEAITAWTEREMLETASRGIGKVVLHDIRGATLLSIDEITAMTVALIAFGLRATLPGEEPPKTLIYTMDGEPK